MAEDKTPQQPPIERNSLASTTANTLATTYVLAKAYVQLKKPHKK